MRQEFMQRLFLCVAVSSLLARALAAQTPPATQPPAQSVAQAEGGPEPGQAVPDGQQNRLPEGVILIPGAESSASDHVTPVPEDGRIRKNVYESPYFRLSYPLPEGWVEQSQGPPPSDSGRYVLTQLAPSPAFKGSSGTILVLAHDLFFGNQPGGNAMEMLSNTRDHLPPYYEVERPPAQIQLGGRTFARFDYRSPAAQLHWYVLTTEIRCHAIEVVLASQDTTMLDRLVEQMNAMKLPDDAGVASGHGGGDAPVCIPDYAASHVVDRVEPALTERRFNPIPARIIIGKNGKVRHVHILSAFASQSTAITDALLQWRFKPYMQNGQPVEVETGLMFGEGATRPSGMVARASAESAKE
jgi:hypothetical protein